MKKLIISLKTPDESLDDFASALRKSKKAKGKVTPHFEIAFDNKKDFNRFVRNISILICIQSFRPGSVNELAQIIGMAKSNLNNLILFFESIGVINIQKKRINGRMVKIPVVQYDTIEFNLHAA